ncbi:MAG: hypothetical protein K0U36_01960, partial [Alphaproteobacteria bacterium]|nr:hypothetical protein [Alphaproteobacteria bacterium]
MQLETVRPLDRHHIIATLKTVALRDQPNHQPYAHASITYCVITPNMAKQLLRPAQRYAITSTLDHQTQLRDALAALPTPTPIDPFFAEEQIGAVQFRVVGEEADRILMPPIIEYDTFHATSKGTEASKRNQGEQYIVADGLHRVVSALEANRPFAIIVVEGMPDTMPYYADPEPIGWDEIPRVAERPKNLTDRKVYR